MKLPKSSSLYMRNVDGGEYALVFAVCDKQPPFMVREITSASRPTACEHCRTPRSSEEPAVGIPTDAKEHGPCGGSRLAGDLRWPIEDLDEARRPRQSRDAASGEKRTPKDGVGGASGWRIRVGPRRSIQI